uniref:Uncharacterized protein n=1 Tax=viral metagenome TaxID=1070528 RepID=A0A6M3KNT1_9ZZZZ
MQKTERFELRLNKDDKVSIKLEANKQDRSMGNYLVWLHRKFTKKVRG